MASINRYCRWHVCWPNAFDRFGRLDGLACPHLCQRLLFLGTFLQTLHKNMSNDSSWLLQMSCVTSIMSLSEGMPLSSFLAKRSVCYSSGTKNVSYLTCSFLDGSFFALHMLFLRSLGCCSVGVLLTHEHWTDETKMRNYFPLHFTHWLLDLAFIKLENSALCLHFC